MDAAAPRSHGRKRSVSCRRCWRHAPPLLRSASLANLPPSRYPLRGLLIRDHLLLLFAVLIIGDNGIIVPTPTAGIQCRRSRQSRSPRNARMIFSARAIVEPGLRGEGLGKREEALGNVGRPRRRNRRHGSRLNHFVANRIPDQLCNRCCADLPQDRLAISSRSLGTDLQQPRN
jgi:hypothetical protein